MKRLLVFVLIALSIANAARMILSLQAMAQVPYIDTDVPPLYITTMSMAWAVVFGMLAFGITRDHRWAARGTIAAIISYQANLWLNHFAFTRSPEAAERIGFAALLSAASIIVVAGLALVVKRKA